MNVFSYLLAEDEVDPSPDISPKKFTVDDNIGEAVHIHYRNIRLEFTVNDYLIFAEHVEHACEGLDA